MENEARFKSFQSYLIGDKKKKKKSEPEQIIIFKWKIMKTL